jgi:hypothetical protein
MATPICPAQTLLKLPGLPPQFASAGLAARLLDYATRPFSMPTLYARIFLATWVLAMKIALSTLTAWVGCAASARC